MGTQLDWRFQLPDAASRQAQELWACVTYPVSGALLRGESLPPLCPSCGALARLNILMFGDWDFEGRRYAQRETRLHAWLARASRPVVIEIGAGTAVPSARRFGEQIRCPLIRINPFEWQVGLRRDIGISLGAMDALVHITALLDI